MSPILFVGFVWRYGLRRTLRGLPERFSWGRESSPTGVLWVHAASVGEVRAVENFIRALPEQFPGVPRLLTTTTVNGKELAQRLGLAESVRLAPLDRPGPVARLIDQVKPKALVLVETELWPHWIQTLSRHRVPVVVINGRISDKAFPLYYWARGLFGPLLSTLARVGVQSPTHASRYLQLGALPESVAITGNLKFDVPLPDLSRRAALRTAYGFSGDDPVWVAGSTHPGEESAVRDVFTSLRKKYPGLRLVAAPRHAQRAGEVARLFSDQGFRVCLRSRLSSYSGSADVLVLDTVGELSDLYGAATVAFVGGSLVRKGGQNPLEPARWGVPTLFGPHMENFREVAALFLENQAAVSVSDLKALTSAVDSLLSSQDQRDRLGSAARTVADRQRGALKSNLDLLGEALAIPPHQLRRPGRCATC
ncbi:MAG: 3-deoxy-D-manno-octulosonic acid transferase [Elusimicrobia bacterium]|nr:3-deoxy-D-manno-octulosonic acid transferase [Elusimicrobiota bacterium]MBP9127432.1 3-deoxy-D-manno-octulosonic acid transferase [Elusimicrobiota bacterium]